MNRRHALIALSGALTTAVVTAAPGRPARAQAATATRLDGTEYRRMTLMGGSLALQQSQLSLTRAADPRVKEFAQFEVNEQTAIAQVLTSSSEANPPPVPLDERHAAMLQQLQAVQGRAFDTAYVQGQLQGHRELLGIQQSYLTPPVFDRDLEHIAILARMSIVQHIAMLEDLQRALPA